MISKDTVAQSESRAEETRSRIFEETHRLVESEGADGLTVRKIAEVANVSPALIIQYFGSKDRLLQQVFELGNIPFLKSVGEWVKTGEPLDEFDLLMWIAGHLLERDLASPRLTLQVMSYSFRWDDDDEEAFLSRLEPVVQLFTACLQKCSPTLSDEVARDCITTFLLCYVQSSRIILTRKFGEEEAKDYLTRHMKIVADGIRAQR